MDVASVILVIITLILWIGIIIEKFLHPSYKAYFKGSRLWPNDPEQRNRVKRFLQAVGLYYFAAALMLLFSPAVALLMGFSGVFYVIITYYWMIVSHRD